MHRSQPRRRQQGPQAPPSGNAGDHGDQMPGHVGYESRDIRVQTVPNTPAKPIDLRWRVVGHSVRGASHVRSGLKNQDAIGWLPNDLPKGLLEQRGAPRVALAVADGHGSPKNFRSDIGARFAVEVSLEIASELLDAPDGPAPDQLRLLSFVKDRLEQDVPRRIAQDWLKRVREHLLESPLSPGELASLEARDGRRSRELVAGEPWLAYGSTLVTAIAMESFLAFWQIGDGDVLTVSAAGKVSRPVPGDDRLIANETTSLCSPEAARQFRVAVLGTPAPMVMLSTDGFSNSFQDDEGFFKFGSDVREVINTDGLSAVAARLEDWLGEMTERGSGDDISLGIICRPDALNPSPGQQDGHDPARPGRRGEKDPPPGPGAAGDNGGTLILGDEIPPAPDPPGEILPTGDNKRSSWWWPASWWRRWQQRRQRRKMASSDTPPGGSQANETSEAGQI